MDGLLDDACGTVLDFIIHQQLAVKIFVLNSHTDGQRVHAGVLRVLAEAVIVEQWQQSAASKANFKFPFGVERKGAAEGRAGPDHRDLDSAGREPRAASADPLQPGSREDLSARRNGAAPPRHSEH